MRNGDFSELLSLDTPVIIRDPLTGQQFSGNMIPQDRLNSLGLKAQDLFFPAPNRGGLVNNLGWEHGYPDDQFHADVISARIDHKLSEKNSLYGRIQIYLPRYVLASNLPTLSGTRLRQSHAWVFTDTHLFSPRVINIFTFGGNRDGIKDGEEVAGNQPVSAAAIVKKIGLQGINPQGFDRPGGSPVFRISGFPTIDARLGGFLLTGRNFNFADSVTWAAGRHVVKFGGELRTYSDFNGQIPNANFGDFTFDGTWSRNAYADFLLGLPFRSTRLNPIIDRERNSKELGLFVMDTFKVTSRLTLDYGLRWDYFGAATFADGLMFAWDRSTGNVIVPGDVQSKVSPFYPRTIKVVAGQVVPDPDKGNFVPRFGVAYRLNDRTVVRGGFGVYYGRTSNSVLFTALTNNAVTTATYNFTPSTAGAPVYPAVLSGPPTTPGSRPSISTLSPDLERPEIYMGDLTVARAVGRTMTVSASYLYSKGKKLPIFIDTNISAPNASVTYLASGQSLGTFPFFRGARPDTGIGRAIDVRSAAESQYHGLVLQAQRRFSGGLLFDVNYTLSKSTDNGQNSTTFIANNSSIVNPFDLAAEEGPSLFDRRHRLVASFHYAPSYLKGFQIGGIGTFESGLPVTATIAGGVAAATGATDTSSTNGSGGDLRAPFESRNRYRGTGRKTIDLRVSKSFSIGGRRQLVALWEGFNVFNWVNYTNFPSVKYRVSSSSYDAASNTVTANLTQDSGFLVPNQASNTLYGPRDMQIGLKVLW